MTRARDLRLDNMRAMLIYMVVLCHMLSQLMAEWGPVSATVYQIINVFHMPAFVLITGYFARFRVRKVLSGLVFPYVCFQLLASIRRNLVAGRVWSYGLTLLEPQWTLWYLLACVLWYCTVPLLERVVSRRAQVGVVCAAFVVSIAAGFAPWLGGFMDLSRVVVLFPFFTAGYFLGQMRLSSIIDAADQKVRRRVCLACLALVVVCEIVRQTCGGYPGYILFRDEPYHVAGDALWRLFAQVTAIVWCCLLFVGTPNRSFGFFSGVGQYTMGIYLLHPWLIRALRYALPLPGSDGVQVLICAALSLAALVAFGNKWVGSAFVYVFGGGWAKPKPAQEPAA